MAAATPTRPQALSLTGRSVRDTLDDARCWQHCIARLKPRTSVIYDCVQSRPKSLPPAGYLAVVSMSYRCRSAYLPRRCLLHSEARLGCHLVLLPWPVCICPGRPERNARPPATRPPSGGAALNLKAVWSKRLLMCAVPSPRPSRCPAGVAWRGVARRGMACSRPGRQRTDGAAFEML